MLRVPRSCLVALIVVWSSCCQASPMELLREINGTLTDPSKKFDRPTRRATAKLFLAYWRSFSDRVPRLPPHELSWLTQELHASSEKVAAVLNRKEYALLSLAKMAEICVDVYTRLSLPEEPGPLYEIYLWAKSINCYREGDRTLEYLTKAGLSNGKYDGPFAMTTFSISEEKTINTIIDSVLTTPNSGAPTQFPH